MENEKIEKLIDNLLFATQNNPPKWICRENDVFELYLTTGTIYLRKKYTDGSNRVVLKIINNQNVNITIVTSEKEMKCTDNNLVKLYLLVTELHEKYKSSLLETLIKETKTLL